MPQQEYEPVPSGISPIIRYYNDLHYAGYQTAGLLTCVDRLFVEVTGQSPSDEMTRTLFEDIDERESREALLLLPLEMLGPTIECGLPPNEVESQYKKAYAWIKRLSEQYHDNSCLSDPVASGDYHCDNSAICPLRAAGHYMMEPVIEADFILPEYSFDPMAAYQMAVAKAKAFLACFDDYPLYYQTYIDRYEQLFVDEFVVPDDPSTIQA